MVECSPPKKMIVTKTFLVLCHITELADMHHVIIFKYENIQFKTFKKWSEYNFNYYLSVLS